MNDHVEQHEDPTPTFSWTLTDDGGATVVAWWQDDDYRTKSEKFVVDDLNMLGESIPDIIRADGRVKGEYPLASS